MLFENYSLSSSMLSSRGNTLMEEKKWAKKDDFFACDEFYCRLFFIDDYFYRRLIFPDEYSYQHFFLTNENI